MAAGDHGEHMNEDHTRRLAREAIEKLPRGICTVYRADDPEQPGGACQRAGNDEGVEAACGMCGVSSPPDHVHVYEREEHPQTYEQALAGYLAMDTAPDMAAYLAGGQIRIRERMENDPLGFCGDGCAQRYIAGEPSTFERRESVEHPYTTVMMGVLRGLGE